MEYTMAIKGPRNPVIHFADGVSVLALNRKNGDVLPCFVDTVDYPAIAHLRWYATSRPNRNERQTYVQASIYTAGLNSAVLLHQTLTGEKHFDHRDGSGLDNRRSNLRPAGLVNNNGNLRLQLRSTSGYKGVSWSKRQQQWEVHCRKKFLGYYDDVIEAATVYDAEAVKQFGEFAKTNF
jgi:hypothetical protein